jgi:transcription initiation factor TFIIF subunit beta
MLLSSDLAVHQMVPKEYNLDMTEEAVKHTFLFTEQDLPGFKSKSRQKFEAATANMPARLTRAKNEKPMSKQPYDPNKRFQPYFRKAIPKRTTLAGKVAHEVNCVAVENEESQRILAERTLEAMRPKRFTKFLNEDVSAAGKGFIQPGTIGAQNTFGGFIVRLMASNSLLLAQKYTNAARREQGLLQLVVIVHNCKRRRVCLRTSC